MLQLSREETLLFLTCGPILSENGEKRIAKLFDAELDWAFILWRAETYQTTPLIRYHLKNLSLWKKVPKDIRTYMKNWSIMSRTRSLRQFTELNRIVDVFDRENIDYYLLKGASLSLSVYPDPLLRPMQDLDLMIYPQDARKVQRLMYSIGYKHGVFNPDDGKFSHIPKKITRHLLENEHELPSMTYCETVDSPLKNELVPYAWRKRQLKCFINPDQSVRMPVFIDLHINLTEGMDLSDVWRGVESRPVHSKIFKFQAPTTALWFTIVRLYHEAFQYSTLKLSMLGDAQAILMKKQSEIDWAELLVMAQKYNMRAPLYYVFTQLVQLTDIEIPDLVIETLKPDPHVEPNKHDMGDVMPKLFSQSPVHRVELS